MITVAFANGKGGVGKSTLAALTAWGLRDRGLKVLVVELDGQGTLSSFLRVQGRQTLDLLSAELNDEAWEGEFGVTREGIQVLSGHTRQLDAVEVRFSSVIAPAEVLRDALGRLGEQWDVVVIDTPPNLRHLAVNGLYAADKVLAVAQTDRPSLPGVVAVGDICRKIGERTRGRQSKLIGVLPNMCRKNELESRAALVNLREIADRTGATLLRPLADLAGIRRAVAGGISPLQGSDLRAKVAVRALYRELLPLILEDAEGRELRVAS